MVTETGNTHTFVSAIAAYLERLRVSGASPMTVKARGSAMRLFARFAGARGRTDVRQVVRADVEAWTAELARRVSRETQHLYLSSVQAFFADLARRGQLLVDPAERVPRPKLHRKEVRWILSHEDVTRLLAAPDVETPAGVRDRAIVELLYATGLRVSELRRVAVADVDPAGGTLHVREGKGGRDRVVPVGKNALAWIRKWLEARPGLAHGAPVEELFVSTRGRALSAQMMPIVIRRIGRKAGLARPLTAHVLRRTCATHLLTAGAPMPAVADLIGHECGNIESLSRYVAVTARELKAAHAKGHPREADDE